MSIAEPGMSTVRARNNVRESGVASGRPIMFAHGFGCSQAVWREVASRFEQDFRVVLFDHVGSGQSDLSAYSRAKYDSLHGYADDVLEIIDDLDLHDVIFVGHSVSSMVGVLAANEAPDRFAALVLVGPSPRYVDDEDYRGGFSPADIEQLIDALDANYLGWSKAVAPLFMDNPDRPELAAKLADSFCRTEPSIARHFAHVTFLSDNRRDLPEVSVPTLIVRGIDDVVAPAEVSDYVHRAIPGSELVTIPVRGHVPNLAGPDELTAAIRSWLR